MFTLLLAPGNQDDKVYDDDGTADGALVAASDQIRFGNKSGAVLPDFGRDALPLVLHMEAPRTSNPTVRQDTRHWELRCWLTAAPAYQERHAASSSSLPSCNRCQNAIAAPLLQTRFTDPQTDVDILSYRNKYPTPSFDLESFSVPALARLLH